MSAGRFDIFFSSRIAMTLLGLAVVVLATAIYSGIRPRPSGAVRGHGTHR